jgi:hypothetical protein
VAQLGGGLRLPAEPLDERRISAVLGGEALDGDRSVQELVLGEEDLGHPSLADRLLQGVAAAVDDGFFRAGHGRSG